MQKRYILLYLLYNLALVAASHKLTTMWTPAGEELPFDPRTVIATPIATGVAMTASPSPLATATVEVVAIATLRSEPTQPAPSGGKHIVVDISEQKAMLYENERLRAVVVVSTGRPGSETRPGHYTIENKIPLAYAETWDWNLPAWLGIYWTGPLQNGFHALPIDANGEMLWGSGLGTPVSYGCIVLSPADAWMLYEWAEVETEVTIQP